MPSYMSSDELRKLSRNDTIVICGINYRIISKGSRYIHLEGLNTPIDISTAKVKNKYNTELRVYRSMGVYEYDQQNKERQFDCVKEMISLLNGVMSTELETDLRTLINKHKGYTV